MRVKNGKYIQIFGCTIGPPFAKVLHNNHGCYCYDPPEKDVGAYFELRSLYSPLGVFLVPGVYMIRSAVITPIPKRHGYKYINTPLALLYDNKAVRTGIYYGGTAAVSCTE